jgi:hypothetical protein
MCVCYQGMNKMEKKMEVGLAHDKAFRGLDVADAYGVTFAVTPDKAHAILARVQIILSLLSFCLLQRSFFTSPQPLTSPHTSTRSFHHPPFTSSLLLIPLTAPFLFFFPSFHQPA